MNNLLLESEGSRQAPAWSCDRAVRAILESHTCGEPNDSHVPHDGEVAWRPRRRPEALGGASKSLTYCADAGCETAEFDGIAGTPNDRFGLPAAERAAHGGSWGSGTSSDGMDMSSGTGMDMGSSACPGDHSLPAAPSSVGERPAPANQMESGRADAAASPTTPHLINGRPPENPDRLVVRRRDWVRLRLVNAGADTAFCFFVEDHPLTVTHADGSHVEPVETDALLIGMGGALRRLIEARSEGTRRMIAVPLRQKGRAPAGLGTWPTAGGVAAPSALFSMPSRIVSYADLHGAVAPAMTTGAHARRG
jgi:hypothetical protein